MKLRGWRTTVVAVGVLAAGCTASGGQGSPAASALTSATDVPAPGASTPAVPAPAPNETAPNQTAPHAASCPTSYAPPDPKRPVTTLRFDIAPDHRSVAATESIDFTPDADISELVFRLTANTAPTYATGTGITVTSAHADHGGQKAVYERAGAAAKSQGGLLRIPFARKVGAGTTVHADLTFRLVIGAGAFDRFGSAGGIVWFASAHPLLAWERGYGWHKEPMIQFTAESATSEAANTDLTVSAPARDVVLMSGQPKSASGGGTRHTWHSTITAARDVSVAAGPFVTRDVKINDVDVRVGALTKAQLPMIIADEKFALAGLARYFGPFPFPNLTLALLPLSGGGIEYPSSIFLLGEERLVTVHETAHQWFYAMVGNSQAQHAWLDEAFASYAEQLLDNDQPPSNELDLPDPVDKPTASYGADSRRYYATTYDKGAAALHAARAAAGADKFDAALRCYVNTQAWTIADPADLAKALTGLPAALAVLKRAGALH